MLNKMHPELWKKFGNQLHLNQKFHPQMTGKLNNGSRVSHTPNTDKGNITLLQGPVRPKPPPFNDQAYHNKEDWRRGSVSQSQGRPYKPFVNNDAKDYMNQPKFQKNQQKTIDQYKHRKGAKKIKKATVKKDEDEEWERFNENVSYKSGVSRCSSKIQTRSKSSSRLIRARESGVMRERLSTASIDNRSVLNKQNLREFEDRISVSSQAPSFKRDKIVFSDRNAGKKLSIKGEPNLTPDEQKDEQLEGEGDNDADNNIEIDNPQGEELQNQDAMSIVPRSDTRSMSKYSHKSYVDSLRNELRREREKREDLEKQVKELIESRNGE
jgi:hypothetical protein